MRQRDFITIACELWPATRSPEGCRAVFAWLDSVYAWSTMEGLNTSEIRFLRAIVWRIGNGLLWSRYAKQKETH